ncbi:MAG: rhodanese family protein [Phycisphaerae bacterium]|nr:rhodanese family protein [Phycisphaerae bacterium]
MPGVPGSPVQTASAAGWSEVDPATVSSWLASGEAVLIDVREIDENAREHITGARLHPLSTFTPGVIASEPSRRVVFHCGGGKRSAEACRLAAGACGPGIELYSMSGGIKAWKMANLPTRVDSSVTSMSIMRQVQLLVGALVLAGSALAWFIHPAFISIPALLGAGLTVAGSTGTCGLAIVLSKMPWNRPRACKVR